MHIDTSSLDANSFILALNRFMSRRGLICSVWSDNDSDFVGANNELKKALKEMKLQKMKTFLQEKPAEWIL